MEGLTKKQKEFADEYLATGNGTKAALKAYDTEDENTAAHIASDNIRKAKIIEYFQSKAEVASHNIYKLANEANNENVKLNANKDILDRAGFKPTEKAEVDVNHKFSLTDLFSKSKE
jgi:phage terminase small subunit